MDIEQDKEMSLPAGNLFQGRRGIIMGLANDKSIAWGIAMALAKQGAEIALHIKGR